MDDELPDPLAAFDQALASMGTFAKLMHGHYTAMLAAGFTDAQALVLTVGYQTAMVRNMRD